MFGLRNIGRSVLKIQQGFGFIRSRSRNSISLQVSTPYRFFCSPPPAVAVERALLDEDVDSNFNSNSNDSSLYSGVDFSSIHGLSDNLLKRLGSLGFKSAFEVQAETLPHTLTGKDVIGRAVTGSGKTLAFAIPIIEKLSSSKRCFNPRAIVIAPTRELCKQVMQSVASLNRQIRCVAVYGGDSYTRQFSEIQRGVDVVCATPGRLRDHIERRSLSLENVEFLILDEADELLTANFKEQIEIVLTGTPKDKQMMLFSATMPPDIRRLISKHMKDPIMVDLVGSKSVVPSTITHQMMMVDPRNTDQIVVKLLQDRKPKRAIVFTPMKVLAGSLMRYLLKNGISAGALHSDMSQRHREFYLHDFRNGKISVIAATDVAARGIDVPEIDLVIHIGPPPSGVDYYIHRSGRTGRKGQSGTSVLLLQRSHESEQFLFELQKSMKVEILQPPTFDDLSEALLDNAVSRVRNVNPKLSAMARAHAKEILQDTDAVDALASALSCMALTNTKTENERREFGDRRGFEDRRGFGDRRGFEDRRGFGDRRGPEHRRGERGRRSMRLGESWY